MNSEIIDHIPELTEEEQILYSEFIIAAHEKDMEEDEDEGDEEEEYYVGAKSGNARPPLSVVVVKAEPLSEPGSPVSSCPPSPPPVIFTGKSFGQSLLKQPTVLLTTKPPAVRRKHVVMQNIVKLESATSVKPIAQNKRVEIIKELNGGASNGVLAAKYRCSIETICNIRQKYGKHVAKNQPGRKPKLTEAVKQGTPRSVRSGFPLPPTPPSSTSSDSEGNVSPLHPSSPSRRLFVSSSTTSQPTRQPIQTPLISSQPKGSTGTLFLTEEEKRTLLAEGYPIPVRLPLTKTEEKSLKKIRRKIKNKISAQESRRKKKEYMDALERKVQILSSENSDFRKKITSLEDANSSLVSQLSKLQAVIARSHNGINIRNSHK